MDKWYITENDKAERKADIQHLHRRPVQKRDPLQILLPVKYSPEQQVKHNESNSVETPGDDECFHNAGSLNQQRDSHDNAAYDQADTPCDHPELPAFMAKEGEDDPDQDCQRGSE